MTTVTREIREAACEALAKVEEIVSNNETWTQGSYARDAEGRDVDPLDPAACSWCAIGALQKAVPDRGTKRGREVYKEALLVLDTTANERGEYDPLPFDPGEEDIVQINDMNEDSEPIKRIVSRSRALCAELLEKMP